MLSLKSWVMIRQPLICTFVFCLLFINISYSEEIERIQYITDKDKSVEGVLTPDPAPGVVPTSNNDYVKFKIDDNTSSISLSGSGGGNASVSKQLPSLTEGRHSATLTTLEPDRNIKDNKQLLFIYDTTPPELTLINPESSQLSEYNISFVVEFSDEGSGFPSQVKDLEASASVNGIESSFNVLQKEGKTYLLIDYKGTEIPQNGATYSLSVTLKDRAGNEANLKNTFTTSTEYYREEWKDLVCDYYHKDEHKIDYWTFNTQRQEVISFPLSSRFRAISFSNQKNTTTLEFSISLKEASTPEILDSISISSGHPAVKVKRLSTTDSSVKYEITQTEVVSLIETFTYLTVEYPKLLIWDYEWECPSHEGEEIEIPEPEYSVSPERESFTIPIVMYWQGEKFYEINSTIEPDGFFYVNYLAWSASKVAPLDIAASYLTLGNNSYFFNTIEDKFRASAPIAKEGLYNFNVTIASKNGVWRPTGTDLMIEDHDIFVNLGAPEIKAFIYNGLDETLEAIFADVGTPIDDLQIDLSVTNYGKRAFNLERISGGMVKLTSPFPKPMSVVEASLSIKDLAGNTAWANFQIFGIPPEPYDTENPNVTKFSVKESPPKENKLNAKSDGVSSGVLSSLSGGLSLYRNCAKDKVLACVDTDVYSQGLRRYTGSSIISYYPYYAIAEDGRMSAPLLYMDLSKEDYIPLFYNGKTGKYKHVSGVLRGNHRYWVYAFGTCENEVRDTLAPEIKSITFNPTDGKLTAIISDHGMPASHIRAGLSVSPEIPRGGSKSYALESTYTPEQATSVKPRQSLTGYGRSSYSIQNDILNSLVVYEVNSRLSPKSGYNRIYPDATKEQKLKFVPVIGPYLEYLKELKAAEPRKPYEIAPTKEGYGLYGTFESTIPIPPLAFGEVFAVTITAADISGNWRSETLSITIPRVPPNVYLELVKKDNSASFTSINNTRTSSHFIATAIDESGIDFSSSKTFLQIDGQKLVPITNHGDGGIKYWPYRFTSGWMEALQNIDYESDLDWIDRYVGHYGALLGEGEHSALFRATDTIGLSAEKQIDFVIEYPPYIFDFQIKPKAVQDIGGPAFTAMIIDSGNDIDVTGINFFINNVAVPHDKLFFDSISGYFSVSGPVELRSGFHTAKIVATDSVGHQATEMLRFVISDDLVPLSGDAELSLESINIWELANQNNDGQANPGELIRLFPTLFNNAPIPLENCSGILSAEDNRISVETSEFISETFVPKGTTTILRGFDIDIGDDILDTTLSDPYDTHFMLKVNCDDDTWELPFVLPIYEPSIPRDIASSIIIELESTPHSTREGDFTLRGTATSSVSYLQDLIIRVNNQEVRPTYFDKVSGEFEALIPLTHGSNFIEIEAYDESGAVGFKTVFVNCFSELTVTIDKLSRSTTDPNITITGTATSSASIVDRLSMSINGIDIPVKWDQKRGTFEVEVTLEAVDNLIIVEAWDEAGAYGRATARVNFASDITVILDSLPPTTNNTSVLVEGTVETRATIDHVTIRVNGANQPASYNSSTGRFSATVNLFVGGNTIVAYAYGGNGERGNDQAFVTRTAAFTPPSITITFPSNGDYFCCGHEITPGDFVPVPVSGSFSTGSSTLDAISVTNTGGICNNITVGAGTFSADCEISDSAGFDTITAEIINNDGTSATDTIIIETGECS